MKLAKWIKAFSFCGFIMPACFAVTGNDKRRGIGRNQILSSGGIAKVSTVIIINGKEIDAFIKTEGLDYAFHPFREGGLHMMKVAGIPPLFSRKDNFCRHADNNTGTPGFTSSARKPKITSKFAHWGIIRPRPRAAQIKRCFKRIKGFFASLKRREFHVFPEDCINA